MTTANENWQRIEAVIKWSEMSNVHKFSKHIGLAAAENLYRIKRGQNGISVKLAERITEFFPEISKGWLLCGEGSMLRTE